MINKPTVTELLDKAEDIGENILWSQIIVDLCTVILRFKHYIYSSIFILGDP